MANVCSFCIIVTPNCDKIIQSVQNVGRDFDKKNVESFQNLLDKCSFSWYDYIKFEGYSTHFTMLGIERVP